MKTSVCDLCKIQTAEAVTSGAKKLLSSLEVEAQTSTNIQHKKEIEESIRLLNILLDPVSE